MKILFIDNYKIFESWASKTYQYKIDQIIKSDLIHYIDIQQLKQKTINPDNFDIIIFGWNATYISKYYANLHDFYKKKIDNLENQEEMKNILKPFLEHKNKYLIVQDLNSEHDYENSLNGLTQYINKYKINGIITPYLINNGINIIKSKTNTKILYLPHHINENYFKDWGKSKKIDVFLFGNTSKKFYPFRNRLDKLLSSQKVFCYRKWDGFKNYFRFNPDKSNDSLSKRINSSWLTICTSSKFDLLLGKYIESSLSNSLICGNIPLEAKELYQDNYIKLDESMTDKEIIDTIKNALRDKIVIMKKSRKMKIKMEQFYLSKYVNHLIQLFD